MAGLAHILRAHRRVGIDTSVFIYHLEGSSRLAAPAGVVFAELAAGAFEGVTSVLTLMEIAVKPLRLNRPDMADEYDMLLAAFPHLIVGNVDRGAARRAAELRAAYRLRPADALQLAVCLQHGATAFLTNDRDFRRVGGLHVLVLESFASPATDT